MQIKLWYYTVSGGDGSAYPRFFSTEEKMRTYMQAEEASESFEGFCEADGWIEIEVSEDGIISSRDLDPTHWDLK